MRKKIRKAMVIFVKICLYLAYLVICIVSSPIMAYCLLREIEIFICIKNKPKDNAPEVLSQGDTEEALRKAEGES